MSDERVVLKPGEVVIRPGDCASFGPGRAVCNRPKYHDGLHASPDRAWDRDGVDLTRTLEGQGTILGVRWRVVLRASEADLRRAGERIRAALSEIARKS